MANSDSYAIDIEDLKVRYGENNVVRGVTLRIKQGEFVSIVGKSGCGKTTLLKAVAGLIEYSGTLHQKGKVRMVFQDNLLLPWLTVEENIRIGVSKKKGDSCNEQGHRLMSEMGIEHLRNAFPNDISGGERQRVAIARAFASNPDIVLMDEPFASLDIFTRERMQMWLLEFWARHQVAILFVTHDIEEGLILGDRLKIMSGGYLKQEHSIPFPRPRNVDIKYTQSFLEERKTISQQIASDGV